ncbi:MAG: trypsin-like peptidase domain-containing protein, partial [Bacteroidota bacterium]
CRDEKFRNQHTGGWCSGFMVGPDVIATAGHCVRTEARAKETAFIFGFYVRNSGDSGTKTFQANQVYFGKELIARKENTSVGDFSIVRVDRSITAPGATPLSIRRNGRITPGAQVGVIGYPSGLPVKIAFGAQTIFMREEGPWLIANLDTYKGNSGSAVFNSDGLVEGILSEGATDFNLDDENSCFRSVRIDDDEGREKVTKASNFIDLIP